MVKTATVGVEYTPNDEIRPDSDASNVSLPYLASRGPILALTPLTSSSHFAASRHCALSNANFELEIDIVRLPFVPRFKHETLAMFSILERETKRVVRPAATVIPALGSPESKASAVIAPSIRAPACR